MTRKTTFLFALTTFLAATLALADGKHPMCPQCPPDENPNGDVFDAQTCVGDTMTSAAAAKKFCAGANTVELSRFRYTVRYRTCNKFTNCDDWKIGPVEKLMTAYDQGRIIPGTELDQGGKLVLQTLSDGVRVNFASLGFDSSVGDDVVNFYSANVLPNSDVGPFLPVQYATRIGPNHNNDELYMVIGPATGAALAEMSGDSFQFTDHCARFFAKGKSSIDSTASWIEYQLGAVAHY